MANIDEILDRIKDLELEEVSIGYSTIRLFSTDKFLNGQIGYSIDPDGKALTGSKEGDWKKSWYVIGYDEMCGDPLFIDSSVETFPVFTTVHGQGYWKEELVADDFESFGQSLRVIQEVASGRENPMLLKNNPISEKEKIEAIHKIEKFSPKSNIEFWELLLSPYE